MRRALFIGILASAALLAFFVYRLDWTEFAATVSRVRIEWLIGAALAHAASITVRAVRWQLIARLPAKRFAAVWHADVVGYVGNAVYPGRAGEVLRVAALHQIANTSPGLAVASAFADRLGDVVVLAGAAAAVSALGVNLPPAVHGAAIGVGAAALGGFVAFLVLGDTVFPLITRLAARLPWRLHERLPRWYQQALEHSRMLRRAPVITATLALSVLAAGCDYVVMWFAIQAMNWTLPLSAAVAASVLVAFGTLLPAAPGYLGIYQIACVLALRPFGVAESPALAYSVVVQVTVLTTLAALGMVVAARYGWAFRPPRR